MKMSLADQVKTWESQHEKEVALDKNRCRFHLMPKVGWMNDPNGLCVFKGLYHVFFQYSPFDANGGMKAWGHYTSKDLLNWTLEQTALFPEDSFDKDGVYSGSAFIKDDEMYLFYTGNVKQDGDYDLIYKGREANTVLVKSKDGFHFEPKELLMTNSDYPNDYSCHIRDPKIWEENGSYYMIQGGRKRNDKGYVLIFESKDLTTWEFLTEQTTEEAFGFMWECPDYFEVDGEKILSLSPQGLQAEEYQYQNIYQSGYYVVSGDITSNCELKNFTEWDRGFDFYAPQTFEDSEGRRILIGWAGMGDADYDNKETVDKGWQHVLTMPRELTLQNGKIYQYPVKEMLKMRGKSIRITEDKEITIPYDIFELDVTKNPYTDFSIKYQNGKDEIHLCLEDGVLHLFFRGSAGSGRTERSMLISEVDSVQLFADTSILEIYINKGEAVFTTRYYFKDYDRKIELKGIESAELFELTGMRGL